MKTFLRSFLTTLALLGALILLPGCTSITTPDGFQFTRFAPFFNGSIGAVEVTTPNFMGRVEGYKSDSAQTIEAVSALVREAKGAAPIP